VSTYELNRFMYDLMERENKHSFEDDAEAFVGRYELSPDERAAIAARDWSGLIERGVSVYILANFGAAVGLTLFDLGASFRGETSAQLSEFIQAQNERISEYAILPEESLNG
jgi:protocatechuate 4,5-dioxygenase, alpha chain